MAYVCFLSDAYSRMIVGWRVAGHIRTSMVLDAIEMARWSRGKMLAGSRCHSDAGSQFTSIRYGERLAVIGAVPSIGTVGDTFDNALVETVNGYYKSELNYGPTQTGPWKTIADVELATLDWPLAQHQPTGPRELVNAVCTRVGGHMDQPIRVRPSGPSGPAYLFSTTRC